MRRLRRLPLVPRACALQPTLPTPPRPPRLACTVACGLSRHRRHGLRAIRRPLQPHRRPRCPRAPYAAVERLRSTTTNGQRAPYMRRVAPTGGACAEWHRWGGRGQRRGGISKRFHIVILRGRGEAARRRSCARCAPNQGHTRCQCASASEAKRGPRHRWLETSLESDCAGRESTDEAPLCADGRASSRMLQNVAVVLEFCERPVLTTAVLYPSPGQSFLRIALRIWGYLAIWLSVTIPQTIHFYPGDAATTLAIPFRLPRSPSLSSQPGRRRDPETARTRRENNSVISVYNSVSWGQSQSTS